jgi:protein O-mannosyl-transferase
LTTPPLWLFATGFVFIAACLALAFIWRLKHPFLLFGFLWYLGTLVPVIGIIQVGAQAMADRYTYIPSIGIFTAGIWGISAR